MSRTKSTPIHNTKKSLLRVPSKGKKMGISNKFRLMKIKTMTALNDLNRSCSSKIGSNRAALLPNPITFIKKYKIKAKFKKYLKIKEFKNQPQSKTI